MFCPKCGKQYSDTAKFCPKCGYLLLSDNQDVNNIIKNDSINKSNIEVVNAKQPNKKINIIFVIIFILPILIIAIVIKLFIFNNVSNSNSNVINIDNAVEIGDGQSIGDNTVNEVIDITTITGELAQVVAQSKVFDIMMENATTQLQMNDISKNQYLLWENEINSIWTRVKAINDKTKQKILLEEERQWIKDKDALIKQAGEQYGNEDGRPLIENMVAISITIERTYYLSKILADLVGENVIIPDYKK